MIFGKLEPSASKAGSVGLNPAPIRPEWIISGGPRARSATLSSSIDNDALTCLWDCTAGTFHWRFDCDETVHIVEGGVVVSFADQVLTLNAGDTAYFPAGSATVWDVQTYVRKVAFLRIPPPRPVSLALRIMRRLLRIASGRPQPAGGLQPQTS